MADVRDVTCPCCGGSLKFEATLQKVKCEYCDTEFEVDALNAFEESNKVVEEKTEWEHEENGEFTDADGMNIYTCKTCGGEVMCDANTTSTKCPYCGNPVILSGRLAGGLKPNYIIPFQLEKKDAGENLIKYFKGKILLPGSFKTENKVQETTCLYVPYWIFDANVNGFVSFRGTRERRERRGDYEYTYTSYYKIVRDGKIGFEHLPVDASKKMDDQMMESIEPFDFSGVKDFSQAYIVGYPADKYDVSKEETFVRANTRIKQGTVDAFRETVSGYDTVKEDTASIQYTSSKASYAMYPVWTLNSVYKEKNYQFAMNGQTGKIVGNLPISVPKAILWFLWTFLVGFALGFGLGWLCADVAETDTTLKVISGIVGGLVIGIIVGVVVLRKLIKQCKPVGFQHGATPYRVANSMQITNKRDIYLYTKTTKRKVASSSNNRRR